MTVFWMNIPPTQHGREIIDIEPWLGTLDTGDVVRAIVGGKGSEEILKKLAKTIFKSQGKNVFIGSATIKGEDAVRWIRTRKTASDAKGAVDYLLGEGQGS
ncbi:MAG: hypothetical protein ACOYB3_01115 [Azonexus sp.]